VQHVGAAAEAPGGAARGLRGAVKSGDEGPAERRRSGRRARRAGPPRLRGCDHDDDAIDRPGRRPHRRAGRLHVGRRPWVQRGNVRPGSEGSPGIVHAHVRHASGVVYW